MFERTHHSRINAKIPMLKLFTVYELSENMTIGQEKSLQHFDRYLLKLRN